MRNKIFLVVVTMITLMACLSNVFANSDFSFTGTTENSRYNVSDIYLNETNQSFQKYIGIYYASHVNDLDDSNSKIAQLVQSQDVTVDLNGEIDALLDSEKVYVDTSSSYEELEKIYKLCLTYKEDMINAGKNGQEVNSMTILEKGVLTIKVGNTVICSLPRYIIVTAEYDETKQQIVCSPYRLNARQGDITAAIERYKDVIKNPPTSENQGEQGKIDFWGDASEWFGQAQQSGYTPPEQVNDIIGIFEDMINIVGTTVIIVATIILGIKYLIGTVDSKTSAKEGLITLLVACVFFFGWTAIKNLLFPGNIFIFTDVNDKTYENMVGRLFATFTYVAQFIVVGAIIYIGIRYIFAGADGRADLKGKSVYFIIGIILVFATTNVLSFVSDIINEATYVESSPSVIEPNTSPLNE